MIALAIQKGNDVHVYDENDRPIFYINGELAGFTSSTVSIKRDGCIFVYNDKGQPMFYHNLP